MMRARLITLLARYWKYLPIIVGLAILVLKLAIAKADLDPVPDEDGPVFW